MSETVAKPRRGRVVEHSATTPDPIRALAGPVPVGPVNRNGLGIVVSGLPRADNVGNLLWWPIVVAVAPVGRGSRAWLRGIRQYASIAALIPIEGRQGEDDALYVWELPIDRPAWSFQEGYLRWHLSIAYGEQIPGDPRGLEPYPGLGTFYDFRYAWQDTGRAASYDARIDGGCVLVLWVEVLQPPDPAAPTLSLNPVVPDADSPDAFVQLVQAEATEGTRIAWHRVAGALIVEHERPQVDG